MTRPKVWTEDKIKRLKDLIPKGYSALLIAQKLSQEFGEKISRQAVTGVCRRMKIRFLAPGGDNAKIKKPSRPRQPLPMKGDEVVRIKPRGKPVEIHSREILSAGQDPMGCRFIHGNVDMSLDGWRYCQRPVFPGQSYCSAHAP